MERRKYNLYEETIYDERTAPDDKYKFYDYYVSDAPDSPDDKIILEDLCMDPSLLTEDYILHGGNWSWIDCVVKKEHVRVSGVGSSKLADDFDVCSPMWDAHVDSDIIRHKIIRAEFGVKWNKTYTLCMFKFRRREVL